MLLKYLMLVLILFSAYDAAAARRDHSSRSTVQPSPRCQTNHGSTSGFNGLGNFGNLPTSGNKIVMAIVIVIAVVIVIVLVVYVIHRMVCAVEQLLSDTSRYSLDVISVEVVV